MCMVSVGCARLARSAVPGRAGHRTCTQILYIPVSRALCAYASAPLVVTDFARLASGYVVVRVKEKRRRRLLKESCDVLASGFLTIRPPTRPASVASSRLAQLQAFHRTPVCQVSRDIFLCFISLAIFLRLASLCI